VEHGVGRVKALTGAPAILERAARVLLARCEQLTAQAEAGDAGALAELLTIVGPLAALLPQLEPEARGALLTTRELAERLGVEPKTVLRRRARGELRPALASGRLIRWRASDALGGNGGGNGARK
jgi:hypothetical protein